MPYLAGCPAAVAATYSSNSTHLSAVESVAQSPFTGSINRTPSTFVATKRSLPVRLPGKIWYQVLVTYLASCPVARSQQQVIATGKSHRARPMPHVSLYCPRALARLTLTDSLAAILYVLLNKKDTYDATSCVDFQKRRFFSANILCVENLNNFEIAHLPVQFGFRSTSAAADAAAV